MHYSKIASLIASAAAAAQATNIITLKSLDNVDRVVHFTPNAGMQWPEPVELAAGKSVDVPLQEHQWTGNLFAVHKGQPAVPGMLAEVAFNSWNDLTFFDVSAIVNPNDVDNVSEMYPYKEPNNPKSGCAAPHNPFPCTNAYYAPDDIQTKSTNEPHLVVTFGMNNGGNNADDSDDDTETKRSLSGFESVNVERDFVLGLHN